MTMTPPSNAEVLEAVERFGMGRADFNERAAEGGPLMRSVGQHGLED